MLQQNFNDMFYFIGSPSPLFVLFMCVALPCLDLPFLSSFTSFYLIRLGCVCFGFSVGRLLPISFPFSRPWLSIVHYAHSLSLSFFVSLYFSVSLCLSHSLCVCCWSINSDDTAVTSKCLFLFRFSFYFYFRWQLTPSRVLCFWSQCFSMPFLYLMICSKSAYYSDPLSALILSSQTETVRTYQMELHVNMFVQKIAFPTFFFLAVICHSQTQKRLHVLTWMQTPNVVFEKCK